jgi:hypothetical protein
MDNIMHNRLKAASHITLNTTTHQCSKCHRIPIKDSHNFPLTG